MFVQGLLFIVLSLTITAIYMIATKDNGRLQSRKEQSEGRLRENVLKKRLEQLAEERVRFSKRYEIETLCLQAGFRLGYVEFVALSVASGLISFLFILLAVNNILMALVFLFLGYFLPKQIIVMQKNIRVTKMDKQIGSFMLMVLKRYENTKDFKRSIELTLEEFKGEEPIHTDIKKTVMEMQLGKPVSEALDGMARRTGNKFMVRLADYYKITSDIGTEESRKKLLHQAYSQYEEDRKAKSMMKRELSGVKREAYIMLGSVPLFAIFQANTNDKYIEFMTKEFMGQVGSVGILIVLAGAVWFINNKISAPLD